MTSVSHCNEQQAGPPNKASLCQYELLIRFAEFVADQITTGRPCGTASSNVFHQPLVVSGSSFSPIYVQDVDKLRANCEKDCTFPVNAISRGSRNRSTQLTESILWKEANAVPPNCHPPVVP